MKTQNHMLLLLLLLLLPDFGFSISLNKRQASSYAKTFSNNINTAYVGKQQIKGFKSTIGDKPVWQYLGIPFAEPPLGPLRFKMPQPLKKPIGNASSPYEALTKPKSCYYWPLTPQAFEIDNPALMMWWNNTEMSEDCLYLNIWTPTVSSGDAKAVMVWIYGGGFFGGSSSLEVYDGAALAAKGDVVVASMQYRTGAFGFLHLDDEESPGNVGLADQLMALKWIKENIYYFGGDNNSITIFGESAGAVSVSFHLLSPFSQNYFTRAILQSGTAIAWWSSEDRAQARKKAKHLASSVGCYVASDNRKRITDCLRHVDPLKIQRKSTDVLEVYNGMRTKSYRGLKRPLKQKRSRLSPYMYFDLPFKPVYHTDFLPQDPMSMLRSGNAKKADLLMGVVKDEGIFWIVYALSSIFITPSRWQIPFWWGHPLSAQVRNHLLKLRATEGIDTDTDPYELVGRYFITNTNMDSLLIEAASFEYQVPSTRFGFRFWSAKDVADAFDDMTGDKTFKCPIIDFAEYYMDTMARHPTGSDGQPKLWMYSFEHRTKHLPLPDWTGVMHGYELDYVFGMPFNKNFTKQFYNFTEKEAELSSDIIRFWSNFAKTGDPNQPGGTRNVREHIVTWPQYKLYNRSHIVLNLKSKLASGTYGTEKNLRRRQCKFWQYHLQNLKDTLHVNKKLSCPPQTRKSLQQQQHSLNGNQGNRSTCATWQVISLMMLVAVATALDSL